MNTLTLDTTVLANAIFPPRRKKDDSIYKEQLRLHTIAKSIVGKVESKKSVMNIPSVAIVEIAAVGARLTGKYERGLQASDYVREHGNIMYDIDFLDKSVDIAAETKVSGFDSIFIACAKISNSLLVTDDKKMHDAAVNAGVKSALLRDMSV